MGIAVFTTLREKLIRRLFGSSPRPFNDVSIQDCAPGERNYVQIGAKNLACDGGARRSDE
jgi:hypothetical protein